MTSQIILGLTLVVILVFVVVLAIRNERQEKTLLANLEKRIKETSSTVEAARKVMEEAIATSSKDKTEDVIVTPKKKRKYKPRNPDKK